MILLLCVHFKNDHKLLNYKSDGKSNGDSLRDELLDPWIADNVKYVEIKMIMEMVMIFKIRQNSFN